MPLIITVLVIGMLSGAELDIFVPSFPELQKHFNLSPFMVQLTLSLNFIAYCVFSLVAGVISDKYDRRKIIIYSLTIFIFGSALCTITTEYYILLVGRVLQGIGIAGPSTLIYVIIADRYPTEKQTSLIGMMHGSMSFAMTSAPILGSYITHYFGWRGNFIALLIAALACCLLSAYYIPSSKGNHKIKISFKAYVPLITSKKTLLYSFTLCLFMVPYWIFIGMSPILYMQDLGVALEHFGFYQGTLSVVFATSSFLSGSFSKKLGQKKALHLGMTICAVHTLAILCIITMNIKNPVIITACMAIASSGVSLPINILYPHALNAIADSKGCISSFISGVRLIVSSAGLWLAGYFYNRTFVPIGICVICTMGTALLLAIVLLKKERKLIN